MIQGGQSISELRIANPVGTFTDGERVAQTQPLEMLQLVLQLELSLRLHQLQMMVFYTLTMNH